ncbi:MAG: V-type ATP synthase subunit E family protein [bacterium]|nr:V-type ATP synthase subunit E family protein [bacterium]
MALQNILDKIKQETSKKLEELEKEFKEKKKKLEEDNEKTKKGIDEDMHNKVEDRKKKIIEKAETLAEREGKNKMLKSKRKLIDEALEEAISALIKADNYETILTDMLKKIDINEENTVIVPARGKEEVTKKAIKESGKKFFLSEKSSDIGGGFILKTDKIEIDNSFETIIKNQMRDDLEIELNKLLF